MTRTRVTIVAGFLGAGKTSVIRHLLSQQNIHGPTAVLVNEIGDAGIDGDLIEEVAGAGSVVKEMAGGCICCSANLIFRQSVVELLRDKPERLIVEPTGVAAVESVRKVFSDPGIAPHVTLDPLLVIVDPRQWDEPRIRSHPLYQEQQASADIIAISHLDICEPELVTRFKKAHSHVPVLRADHGVLSDKWWETDIKASQIVPTEVSSKGIKKKTLTWPAHSNFDIDAFRNTWAETKAPTSLLRCKGIVNTSQGWVNIQASGEDITIKPTIASGESRLVAIMLDERDADRWWSTFENSITNMQQQTTG